MVKDHEDGIAVPPVVDKAQDGVVSTPPVNEDKNSALTVPMVTEDQGGVVAPVMSHEKSTDPTESVIGEGETQYEGKGKGRAESFSHLPTPGDSAPSTAPGTRPVSQAQDDSAPTTAPSTAPSTRPTSQIPDNSDTLPLNLRARHDCGCTDIYDHAGKKRQQACDLHKLNPNRSVLPLPAKKPLGVVTNLDRGTPVYTPQAKRYEESPPREPPVVTPTKGRNFVQGSEDGPTFLDSFNSDRAIEPTGPPDTLTTIPTQEDTYLTDRLPGEAVAPDSKESIPKVVAATPGTTQDPETEPRQSEIGEDNEDRGIKVGDEGCHQFTVKEDGKSVGTASGPVFKKERARPKSILKKTVGTAAEARQTGRSVAPLGQVEEPDDDRRGVRLFRDTVGRLRGSEGDAAASDPSGPVQGGVPIPMLVLDTAAGPIGARTNSNGEPVFHNGPPAYTARDKTRDGDGNDLDDGPKTCPNCALM